MLQADLKAAGIVPVDASGRVFDFHSLRHQFITNLAMAGVHPKTAQILARHSTIVLTMDRYTHLDTPDQTAALDKLPRYHRSASRFLPVLMMRHAGK
jgi:integrase